MFETTKDFDELLARLNEMGQQQGLDCNTRQLLCLVRALDYFREKCDTLVTDICPKDDDFERCTGMRRGDCLLTEALLQ